MLIFASHIKKYKKKMQKSLNKAWLPNVKKRQDGVDKQQKK